MANETKSIPVVGKDVKIVTLQATEFSPEVASSFLARGATHARMALLQDKTKIMSRNVRRRLVKDVFKEQK